MAVDQFSLGFTYSLILAFRWIWLLTSSYKLQESNQSNNSGSVILVWCFTEFKLTLIVHVMLMSGMPCYLDFAIL